MRRAVGAIRAKATPEAGQKEKALDELREQLRKLEDRLGRLEGRAAAGDA